MYEEYGTNKVPYAGTLQLQYQDLRNPEVWHNIGAPTEFGKSGGRSTINVIKLSGITDGTRTVTYRLVTANNEVLKYTNTNGKEVDFSLNMDTKDGRVYLIYARGIRTSKSIVTSLTAKPIH